MTKLPLKVQVSIRDNWEKDDCSAQAVLKKLREVIGVNTVIEPEWQLLLAEMGTAYEDKARLVIDVANCVISWANSLILLAEDDSYSEWAEELLEKVNGRIKVYFEITRAREPVLLWSQEREAFVIELCQPPIPDMYSMENIFNKELSECFKEKSSTATLAQRSAARAGDDWADVGVDTETGTPAVIEQANLPTRILQSPSRPRYDTIPDLSAIARPDELLLQPPYHLTVTSSNSRFVEVQCSHSPTLQFLAEYLRKWCKTNAQDNRKPPSVEIKLHQSAFGLGLNYDRLTLEIEARWSVYTATPMPVLSLVEGVLGYQPVRAEDSRWVFRRDVELRKGR